MNNNPSSSSVIILTGASSGIGYYTALAFAKPGSKIVLVARRRERLDELAKKVEEKGAQPLVLALDLAEPSASELIVKETIKNFGRIDLLINNAGFGQQMLVEETSDDSLRKIFEVNVFATINTTKKALPYLRESKGCIINVASVAGFTPMPLHTLYSATKHALVGFGKSLRFELIDSGVTILTVCPGPVATEFMDSLEGLPFPKWLLKWGKLFIDTPECIAQNIARFSCRTKSAVLYASLRSRLSSLGYHFCRPIADQLYFLYVRKMRPKTPK